jgi:hypothetical protein
MAAFDSSSLRFSPRSIIRSILFRIKRADSLCPPVRRPD